MTAGAGGKPPSPVPTGQLRLPPLIGFALDRKCPVCGAIYPGTLELHCKKAGDEAHLAYHVMRT